MALGSDLVRKLLEIGFPDDVVLNINFPDREPDDVEGVVVTEQGRRNQDLLRVEDRMDTRGNPYYWLGFRRRRSEPAEGTDLWAIYTGRVSVTPLNLNLTHNHIRGELASALSD
jgi:5'-nucleotidase